MSRVAAIASLLILAGCGAADPRPPATGDGAFRMVAAAKRALMGVRGYHVEATWIGGRQPTQLFGDFYDGNAKVTIVTRDGAEQELVVDGVTYLKADRATWARSRDRRQRRMADALADRWVRLPSPTRFGLWQRRLQPHVIGRCLSTTGTALVDGGVRRMGDQRAVVLRDVGDPSVIGTGEMWVAASGAPRLLRLRLPAHRSGYQRAQPRDPACDQSDGSGAGSAADSVDLRFSAYDRLGGISAPKRALSLAGTTHPRTPVA